MGAFLFSSAISLILAWHVDNLRERMDALETSERSEE